MTEKSHSRRRFLKYAGAGVVAVAVGSGYLWKDSLYSLTETILSPKPTITPTITPTLTPTLTPGPTPSETPTRLVDLELLLFHDYHGDGAKQSDEPVITDAVFDVIDEKGKKVLSEIKGNGNGIYRLEDLKEYRKYRLFFSDKIKNKFSFHSFSDGDFSPIDVGFDIPIDQNKTSLQMGLMNGPLTLPIRKGTAWYFRQWSFVDVGDNKDWRGGGQTYSGHTGTDFYMLEGTPIVSAAPGKVFGVKGWSPQDSWTMYTGNQVTISHSSGICTRYYHLKNFTVNEGLKVDRGQVIGHCGHTGLFYYGPNAGSPMTESWSHVHLEVSKSVVAGYGSIDPYRNIKNSNSKSLWTKDNDPQYPLT